MAEEREVKKRGERGLFIKRERVIWRKRNRKNFNFHL